MCLATLIIGLSVKPTVEMIPGKLIQLTVNNFRLLMKCVPHGDHFAYKWEKKNEKSIPRSQGINSRLLTITDLRPEDSGEYRCIARNSTGTILSDYSLLTVKGMTMYLTMYPCIYVAMYGIKKLMEKILMN